MAISLACHELAAAKDTYSLGRIEDAQGNLLEIKERRRVVLIVSRNLTVDANGSDASIATDVLKTDPKGAGRYTYPYRVIASKLNRYIRKYRSMNAVEELAHADYIIYFNVLEYRRTVSGFYPYGELFIILNRSSDDSRPPRVIWKTKKVMWAEDAVNKFLKELKRVRGEG